MAKKEKSQKKEKPATTTVKEIPGFYDSENQLRTLKQSHFPKTREGKVAYCDYQIAKWGVKKEVIAQRMDPLARKKKQREKLLEKLQKLEADLKEEEQA